MATMRKRAAAGGSAVVAGLLLTLAITPTASAETDRTLNLAISCATGEAYGLQLNTGSGFYQPSSGSSYVSGGVKYFTVPVSASATFLAVMPLSCANQPSGSGPDPEWNWASITPGTSTINANSFCQDYSYNYGGGPVALIFDCTISSVSYS